MDVTDFDFFLPSERIAAYPAAQYQEAESYPFGQGTGEAVPLEEYDFGSYNR